jgi:tRNA (guanine37-N1)-methyltransferase
MLFDILTIFPEFFAGPLDHGIIRKAREEGLIDVRIHNLRDFTADRHRVVDDRPFGGEEGMVLKPEPIFAGVETLQAAAAVKAERRRVVLLSARGHLFNQARAAQLARLEHLILICGRYEGVDERVAEHLADEEICIGDYVLTGGELPAAVVVDAVSRLVPGALGHELSAVRESFGAPAAVGDAVDILDCPHYTRPADFRGMQVPEVLVSGHHEQIRRWRRKKALEKTVRNRPELLERVNLTPEDRLLLLEIHEEKKPV